jgi:hypothetical protein
MMVKMKENYPWTVKFDVRLQLSLQGNVADHTMVIERERAITPPQLGTPTLRGTGWQSGPTKRSLTADAGVCEEEGVKSIKVTRTIT